jgi:hypothetical protein
MDGFVYLISQTPSKSVTQPKKTFLLIWKFSNGLRNTDRNVIHGAYTFSAHIDRPRIPKTDNCLKKSSYKDTRMETNPISGVGALMTDWNIESWDKRGCVNLHYPTNAY